MGGLWPQLTGSISQLTPKASAKGVGVPSLADEPVLLLGCLEGRRPLGEVGSPGLPSWTLLPGPEQAAGGPSEDPRLTLAIPNPENYLNTTLFLLSLLSQRCPPPEWGGSNLCCRFWGQETSTSGT